MSEEKDGKVIKLIEGKRDIPADLIPVKDTVYGERFFIRNGEEYTEVTKPPKVPVRTHRDRKYVMHETSAFVESVLAYGDSKAGVIFYELLSAQGAGSGGSITMFFDHVSRDEHISLPLRRSLEFRAFLNGPEKSFTQKDFLKLIETWPECVTGVDTLKPNIEKITLSKQTDFESNLDPDNLTFLYQEKGGSQTGKLPKKLNLTLPFFEGSRCKVEISADLEVTMPKSPDEKPTFKLVNVKHERTERDALSAEIQSMQKELPGWLFINGKS